MTWVSWRLQRAETLIAAAILVALTLILLPSGLQMASAFRHDHLAQCVSANSTACGDAIGAFRSRFENIDNLTGWLTLIPGIIGALLAAPFVLELEQGTYRLAWTQGITRRRWIIVKLGLAVLAAIVAAALFVGFLTWWRTPFVQLDGRMQTSAYDSMGVVPVGYVLFAVGLAAAVGTVWRRAVPALVISFMGYFVARLFVDTWLRQRLVGAVSETTRFSKGQMSALNHAWVLNQYPSNSAGQRVSESIQCLKGGSRCVVHAPEFMHVVYIPASRFWALQGVEFALFGGAALILLAFAAWWTHERIG